MKMIDPEIEKVVKAIQYRPAISIILPIEPKIILHSQLNYALKIAADKVELQIRENYTKETCDLIMKKLTNLIRNLKFESNKKGIVIYISLIFEKVFFLDFGVQEKIVVDNTFEIRDLVYSTNNSNKYLILILSANESKMYLSDVHNNISLIPKSKIKSNTFLNDKIKNEHILIYPDLAKRKEIELNKYLLYVDNEADKIFRKYNYPLFILGSIRTTAHFKKITKHFGKIAGTINGNYEEATSNEIQQLMEPHFAKLQALKKSELLNKIDAAESKKKLAVGIQSVWREAISGKGSLLIVEKNYTFAAEHGGTKEVIYPASEPYNKYSLIRDAVDDVIEKVLEFGGNVEFVEEGVLDKYEHIALLLYF